MWRTQFIHVSAYVCPAGLLHRISRCDPLTGSLPTLRDHLLKYFNESPSYYLRSCKGGSVTRDGPIRDDIVSQSPFVSGGGLGSVVVSFVSQMPAFLPALTACLRGDRNNMRYHQRSNIKTTVSMTRLKEASTCPKRPASFCSLFVPAEPRKGRDHRLHRSDRGRNGLTPPPPLPRAASQFTMMVMISHHF